jgi:diacylglycerol kinase family enzyme
LKTHPDLKITLVHNEKAGSSGSSDELHAIIERAGHRIVRTWEPEALSALAARGGTLTDAAFAGSELLVVAGGDGTVQRVATEVAGRSLPLAILPLGTANNIATSLGIQGPTETLVASWATAVRSPLDLGVATGPWGTRRFIESVGGGLVANGIIVMDSEAPHIESTPPEMLEKALARFRVVLSGMTARRCRLVLDGEVSEPELLLCEVLNIRAVGPALRLAPDAEHGDAYFDVVTADESHRALLDHYLHERSEGRQSTLELPMRRARRVGLGGWDRIHIDDTIHADVDALCVLSVSPAALEVLVPHG